MIKPKRMKHQYTDELELKSLIIRINNRTKNANGECFDVDNSAESCANNASINRHIKLYKKVKASKSVSLTRKVRMRNTRHKLKAVIIKLSENCTIDQASYEIFGGIVLLMIKSILTKPNFATTGYDSEFYSDSVYKISKYIHNFDHLKISDRSGIQCNAFAYVSQIIHNAFLFICNKKRDERAHHKKQINMEMLDDNQKLKYIDLHVDERTKFHDHTDIVEETIKIKNIEEGDLLVNKISEILLTNKSRLDNVDKITIIYPSAYRISYDEYNDMKQFLNGKLNIIREKEIVDEGACHE